MPYQSSYDVLKERLGGAWKLIRGHASLKEQHTSVEGSLSINPRLDKTNRLWVEINQQNALYEEIEQILLDHPYVAAGIYKYSDGATRSVNITVKSAIDERTLNKAKRIINRTIHNCKLKRYLRSFGFCVTTFGNGYAQPVINDEGEIIKLLEMPVIGMVRNTNHLDEFIPGKPAFIQRTQYQEEIGHFAQGQILHIRDNHRPGQRYGMAKLFPGRSAAKDSLAALRSLLPRRLANQPFRHFDIGGAQGRGVTQTLFDQIRKNLSRVLHLQKGGEITPFDDVFTNNVRLAVLGGDPNLGTIDDIELLIDSMLILIGVSRQLLGAGTNINRDILDEQREELYAAQRLLATLLEEDLIRPLIDLALALQDITPANVEYSIEFADQYTDSRMERRVDRAIKMFQLGALAIEDLMPVAAPYLNITNVDAAIERAKSQGKPSQITEPFPQEQDPNQDPGIDPTKV